MSSEISYRSSYGVIIPLLAFLLAPLIPVRAEAGEITNPARKREIVEQARKLYFKYPKVGFKGLKCDIGISLRDALKTMFKELPADDPRLAMVRDFRYSLAINIDGSWSLRSSPLKYSGDTEADEGMEKMLAGFKQSLEGYLRLNRAFLFEDMFDQLGHDYKLFEDADGYRIVIAPQGAHSSELMLTKDLVLTSMSIASGGGTMSMTMAYLPTDNGLLLNRLAVDGVGMAMQVDLDIEYQTIDGMMVPVKVTGSLPGGQTVVEGETSSEQEEVAGPLTVEFDFLDCKVTKSR